MKFKAGDIINWDVYGNGKNVERRLIVRIEGSDYVSLRFVKSRGEFAKRENWHSAAAIESRGQIAA